MTEAELVLAFGEALDEAGGALDLVEDEALPIDEHKAAMRDAWQALKRADAARRALNDNYPEPAGDPTDPRLDDERSGERHGSD